MNIFYISNDPTECAQALDSLRLNKMMIESIQMLSTAAHKAVRGVNVYHPVVQGIKSLKRLKMGSITFEHISHLAKETHAHHPCTMWCGESRAHYEWLIALTDAMHTEWIHRGHKPHRCYVDRMPAIRTVFALFFQRYPKCFTPPPNCSMYEDEDVMMAYKKTLVKKWKNDKRPPTWENRGEPAWRKKI